MIKNLNQVTFQGFGTVLPERAQANQPAPKNAVRMKLTQMEASVYQAKSETMLNCTGDMCVLSVSKDGEDYQHFYLDKTVHIRKNIFFSLSVYKDEASVILSAEIPPERIGTTANRKLRIDAQLRVAGIYTFFYQEKEQGFLFPGESHHMPELT